MTVLWVADVYHTPENQIRGRLGCNRIYISGEVNQEIEPGLCPTSNPIYGIVKKMGFIGSA
jgi:hypothetical protein